MSTKPSSFDFTFVRVGENSLPSRSADLLKSRRVNVGALFALNQRWIARVTKKLTEDIAELGKFDEANKRLQNASTQEEVVQAVEYAIPDPLAKITNDDIGSVIVDFISAANEKLLEMDLKSKGELKLEDERPIVTLLLNEESKEK